MLIESSPYRIFRNGNFSDGWRKELFCFRRVDHPTIKFSIKQASQFDMPDLNQQPSKQQQQHQSYNNSNKCESNRPSKQQKR